MDQFYEKAGSLFVEAYDAFYSRPGQNEVALAGEESPTSETDPMGWHRFGFEFSVPRKESDGVGL